MIAQYNCIYDWVVYLEGDEIIDVKDIPYIKSMLNKYLEDSQVEAFVFNYYHFYGSPDYIASSPRWYKMAPRIIRNSIRTWAPDGLFWVVMNKNKQGRYPFAKLLDCYIYHYGHVRPIIAMNEKNKRVEKYWGKAPRIFNNYNTIDPKTIIKFTGAHPEIIKNWINTVAQKNFNNNFAYKLSFRDIRHRILVFINKVFFNNRLHFGRKHFKLIK